ncbi:MAG: ATP-binding cassette domain-containing protein [Lachnospiraceae bacterium]|jgi:energy-coupling factor transport system ATP-binding protein|nr:ATP-binding cassette domain-containing protein [Lachnospiraceae bacterium]MEE3460294.1 ATP-binding cassette domain-containing protein [Lachnospiraceae bacterium]
MAMILEKINYKYPDSNGLAVHDLSVTIEEGHFIALTGQTGSGKSTLLRILAGLYAPSSGSIELDGGRELKRSARLVFQYPEDQLFCESVIEDVEFGPKNQGLSQIDMEKRSFDALHAVGISDDLLDVSPFALSGGQKRLVAIAGLLAMDPDILLLDEPTAGLDPETHEHILDILKALVEDRGRTVIIASHSMDDVAEYADTMLVMNRGRLLLNGSPEKIFQYEDALTSVGLGIPQTVRLLSDLKRSGLPVDTTAITKESCLKELTCKLVNYVL